SGSGGRLLAAAVLAFAGGGGQVAGQAVRAGLDRRRIAEHHLTAAGLDVLIGHHDEEVDNGDENNEINDRGDEGAKVHKGLRIVVAAELDAQALGAAALEAGHDGVYYVGRERRDQAAEGQRDDQPDRDDDDVAAEEKVPETPQHAFFRFATTNGPRNGRG